MNKIELLKWQVEMGADEATEEAPINRIVEKIKSEEKKIVSRPTENNAQNHGFSEPLGTELSREVISRTDVAGPMELEKRAREIADKCQSLEELREAVKNFDGLSIKKTATNTVFSDGNPEAKVMLIGEAPGANEDIEGIPFCGASGKLMDALLNWAGFYREKNIYISNTVFWRPPGNRTPTPEELAVCRPFVEKHIALINPKILGLVGGTATFSLLGTNTGVTKLRNKNHSYTNKYLDRGIPVFVFFHPSYLLRQPSQKKTFWFDLLRMKEHLKINGLGV